VRLVSATLYALNLPFVEAFRHSQHARDSGDSIVLQVRDEAGHEGFGEGVPRPYVTGESAEFMWAHVPRLWASAAARPLPSLEGPDALSRVAAWIPPVPAPGVLADNASRACLETAVLDCLLKGQGASLAHLLPARRSKVVYSGVITAGSLEKALQQARRMKVIGLTQVKAKVGYEDDVARVRALRETLGPGVSLRLDANGAWSFDRARGVLDAVAGFDVAAVEQPLARGPVAELARLRVESPVPLMADESLVTLADADELVAARAVDYFNVRVSKCGGLHRSLQIARRAAAAGLRVQVGSQVGETAILSAAGRHLAAHLDEVAFVEGSFGNLLLTEDVSREAVRFGHKGEAPPLTGEGLGIRVLEERLRKYARETRSLLAEAAA
jgi:muconate cycloisomerase